jgi:hypothetical protein
MVADTGLGVQIREGRTLCPLSRDVVNMRLHENTLLDTGRRIVAD